jgi:hypothetical protein
MLVDYQLHAPTWMLEVYLEYLSTIASEEWDFCVRSSNQGLLLSPTSLSTLRYAFRAPCGVHEEPFVFCPLLLLEVSKGTFPARCIP